MVLLNMTVFRIINIFNVFIGMLHYNQDYITFRPMYYGTYYNTYKHTRVRTDTSKVCKSEERK